MGDRPRPPPRRPGGRGMAGAPRQPCLAQPAGVRAAAGGERDDGSGGHRRPAQPGPRRPPAGPDQRARGRPRAPGALPGGADPRRGASVLRLGRPPCPCRSFCGGAGPAHGRADALPDPGPGRPDDRPAPGGRRPRPGRPRPRRARSRDRGADLGPGQRGDLRSAARAAGPDEVGGRAEDGLPGDGLARAADARRRHRGLRPAAGHQLGQPQLPSRRARTPARSTATPSGSAPWSRTCWTSRGWSAGPG